MDGQHLAWTLVLGLLLLWQPAVAAKQVKCSSTSLCFFDCGDYVMDLTALKNTVFKDVIDSKGQNQFSYSPCARFSEGTGCFKTHVCQKSDILSDTNETIDVGSEVKASLNPHGGPNYFTYTHKEQDKVRTTKVTLKCASANEILAKDPLFTVTGESPDGSGHYVMTLKTQHACFKFAPTGTTKAMTSETTRVTTKQTTHQTTSTRHVTTEKTTAATTPTRQPTTEQTTPPATTHSTHVTTEPATTPSKGNATTEPTHNATTEVTTAAVTTRMTTENGNVTTPGTNATTTVVVTTAIKNETTTVYVTSPGASTQTTQGGATTAPTGGASTPGLSSQTMVLLGMLSAAVAALSRL